MAKSLFKLPNKEPVDSIVKADDKYTTKMDIPHYTPKGNKPSVGELYDKTKYSELCKAINR